MEQKKIWEPEWEPQVKQRALLASPIYIGQAQGEETNRWEEEAKTLETSLIGSAHPHTLKVYYPLLAK